MDFFLKLNRTFNFLNLNLRPLSQIYSMVESILLKTFLYMRYERTHDEFYIGVKIVPSDNQCIPYVEKNVVPK